MNVFKLQILLFFNILYVSDSERRITGGYQVLSEKGYTVYLVKAPNSTLQADEWLCGGALVTTWFILTSGACVEQAVYMYAIAGYNKYVHDDKIETDPCTKEKKKKVVYFCVPERSNVKVRGYHWLAADIALAKVESEYDPHDDSFKTLCSYTPTVIPINYELRFQQPGTDAIVLGWGHTNDWRMPYDKAYYNQNFLRYARIQLAENKLCEEMADVIDEYNLLCSIKKGDLDETGKLNIQSPSPKIDGCKTGLRTQNCTDKEIITSLLNFEETPRNSSGETPTNSSSGICNNDHGGPLVTWVGSKEVLIGIAAFPDYNCEGPFLYTSTAYHGAFLHCVLTKDSARRGMCDSPPIKRGFKIIERYISWADHPAGPSENEVVSAAKHASDTSNNQRDTTKVSNTFEALIKLESFWQQYNSKTNESAAVAREN